MVCRLEEFRSPVGPDRLRRSLVVGATAVAVAVLLIATAMGTTGFEGDVMWEIVGVVRDFVISPVGCGLLDGGSWHRSDPLDQE